MYFPCTTVHVLPRKIKMFLGNILSTKFIIYAKFVLNHTLTPRTSLIPISCYVKSSVLVSFFMCFLLSKMIKKPRILGFLSVGTGYFILSSYYLFSWSLRIPAYFLQHLGVSFAFLHELGHQGCQYLVQILVSHIVFLQVVVTKYTSISLAGSLYLTPSLFTILFYYFEYHRKNKKDTEVFLSKILRSQFVLLDVLSVNLDIKHIKQSVVTSLS